MVTGLERDFYNTIQHTSWIRTSGWSLFLLRRFLANHRGRYLRNFTVYRTFRESLVSRGCLSVLVEQKLAPCCKRDCARCDCPLPVSWGSEPMALCVTRVQVQRQRIARWAREPCLKREFPLWHFNVRVLEWQQHAHELLSLRYDPAAIDRIWSQHKACSIVRLRQISGHALPFAASLLSDVVTGMSEAIVRLPIRPDKA